VSFGEPGDDVNGTADRVLRQAQVMVSDMADDLRGVVQELTLTRRDLRGALTLLGTAYKHGLVVMKLGNALNDYAGADLRRADLGKIRSLDGIRWTTSTQWPAGSLVRWP
jgi:hypothetical protein